MRFGRRNGDGNHQGGPPPKGWAEEYDRRAAKQGVEYEMPTGAGRVKDDNGNYFTRDGKACCGCGRHRNNHGYDPDTGLYHDNPGASRPQF